MYNIKVSQCVIVQTFNLALSHNKDEVTLSNDCVHFQHFHVQQSPLSFNSTRPNPVAVYTMYLQLSLHP